jgi:glucokinase
VFVDTRIIGVDLGGTRMRVALLDADYNLLNRVEEPTNAHEGPDKVIPRLLDLIASVVDAADVPVAGIGISSPGPIEPETGAILSPPNLPGWVDVPLGRIVQERWPDIPVFLGNDANVAALAEVYNGAAIGHKHAIYITVSTGIGGGIVIDGQLFLGGRGLAGEIGHTVLIADGERVSSLEEEAAGPALAEYAARRLQAGEESIIREMVGGDLEQVTGKIVGQAAQQGDTLALEAVARTGRLVGYGIASLMHLFNPTIFVIGGGVSNLGDLLFEPMHEAARSMVIDPAYYDHAAIVPAALGEDVAIIGAAALALQELKQA